MNHALDAIASYRNAFGLDQREYFLSCNRAEVTGMPVLIHNAYGTWTARIIGTGRTASATTPIDALTILYKNEPILYVGGGEPKLLHDIDYSDERWTKP